MPGDGVLGSPERVFVQAALDGAGAGAVASRGVGAFEDLGDGVSCRAGQA